MTETCYIISNPNQSPDHVVWVTVPYPPGSQRLTAACNCDGSIWELPARRAEDWGFGYLCYWAAEHLREHEAADDGFVTVGLEGVVTGIVHPGYAGAREHMVRVDWFNDTTSRLPVAAVEVIEVAA